MPLHEDQLPRVAIAFSTVVQTQDITNATSRDEYASATNVATFQAVNATKEALAHEADKPIYAICNRVVNEANGQAFFTDSDIAAANSDISATYLMSAQFTEDDGTLPVKYHGSRG